MRTDLIVKPEERSITVVTTGDIEAVLENNKRLRNSPQKSESFRHVASIPPVICIKWLDEVRARGYRMRIFSKEWDELVARKLRDPDWKYLRTDK